MRKPPRLHQIQNEHYWIYWIFFVINVKIEARISDTKIGAISFP